MIDCVNRKSLDVSDEAQVDRVKQLVGDAVFKNLAMRVKLDKKPEADTPVDRAAITDPPGGVHPPGGVLFA